MYEKELAEELAGSPRARLPAAPAKVTRRRRPGGGGPRGRGTRLALLIASLLAGLVIALLTVHLAGKWESLA